MLPVPAYHKRRAAAVAAAWPKAPRSQRRASALWFWRNCDRPVADWRQFWQQTNAANGVVHY